jgi:hypothetical protein
MKHIHLPINLIRCPICGSQSLRKEVKVDQTFSTIKKGNNEVTDRISYYHNKQNSERS